MEPENNQDQQGDAREDANPDIDEEDPSLLLRRVVVKGSRPGDEIVRLVPPRQRAFRRVSGGLLEATKVTLIPRNSSERLKRLLIGEPIATAQAEHERLTNFKALAVLSSDAISSVAYATEAILITLIAAGSGNLGVTLPISFAIVGLLAIVAISYRQTIYAYPSGGGSYIVAKDNLGTLPGLIAAASLMIDYVLTVAVSISAGVQALATLFPALSPTLVIVTIDVVLVMVITIVNLRGLRESGTIFAIPTYIFIVSALLLIAVGCIKSFLIQHQPIIGHYQYVAAIEPLSVFLILRSFAAGCSAMTGVEAISNGVPAFKKPETRNAAITLTWMATILGTLFIGLTLLATSYHIEANPAGNPTVIGQIAQLVFTGPLFFMYLVFQLATLLILVLAANTSYSDFPRLASLLARDDFLPHQFAFRGDRFAFSIGITFLAVLAGLLLIVFRGNTTQLINLYAVGVFISFTLSQSGMVRHWWRLRGEQKGWQRSMVINGIGALTTLLVALVIATTKFLEGAWIVVVLIPLLVLLFTGISHHYKYVEHERITSLPLHPQDIRHRIIVPIAELNHASKQALAYARSISPQVTAVNVAVSRRKADALRAAWDKWQTSLSAHELSSLDIIDPGNREPPYPLLDYFDLAHRTPQATPPTWSQLLPLLDYFDAVHQQYPEETLTVVLPEVVESSLRRLFYSPKILRLKATLFFRQDVVVTNVSLQQRASTGNIPTHPKEVRHRFIVPIAELDRAAMASLAYARSTSPHVIAAHVAIDADEVEVVRSKWEDLQKQISKDEGVQLVVIESPYRSLARPLLTYIDTVQEMHPEETLTVILPEFVVAHWWEYPLHNQTAVRLKAALLARPSIVVTDIPRHLRR